jgi:predicted TPR repeat methyltransferase
MTVEPSALHDAYAADYDAQVAAYDCHIAEVLFGLTFERIQPGERLLDTGIGTGLSSAPYAKAGLEVHGMDFSQAMLDICSSKGIAAGLKRHDLQYAPWPYADGAFHHAVCCGVLHFVAELDAVFGEAARVLKEGGTFAFTTRAAESDSLSEGRFAQEAAGPFDIFSHAPAYIETLLGERAFARRKVQRCYVGDDLFVVWVAEKQGR